MSADFNSEFGKRFKLIRKELNLNQEDISAEFNIGKGTVSEWEHGKYLPPIPFLLAFTRKYNVNLLYLLEGGDNPKYYDQTEHMSASKIHDEFLKSYEKKENRLLLEVIEHLKDDQELLETVWHLVQATQGIRKIGKEK